MQRFATMTPSSLSIMLPAWATCVWRARFMPSQSGWVTDHHSPVLIGRWSPPGRFDDDDDEAAAAAERACRGIMNWIDWLSNVLVMKRAKNLMGKRSFIENSTIRMEQWNDSGSIASFRAESFYWTIVWNDSGLIASFRAESFHWTIVWNDNVSIVSFKAESFHICVNKICCCSYCLNNHNSKMTNHNSNYSQLSTLIVYWVVWYDTDMLMKR